MSSRSVDTSGVPSEPPRCFDRALAEYPIVMLPLERVIDLLPITHAEGRVNAYRTAMLQGSLFPPVSAIRLFGRYLVADGHKRLSACRSLGIDPIPVEVWTAGRWLRDQRRQLSDNARKNRRIVAAMFSEPRESLRLLSATAAHWRRVAICLTTRLLTPKRG